MSGLPNRLREYGSDAQMQTYDRSFILEAAEAIEAARDALAGLSDILGRAESNASGNPEWPYVSKRINAARAALAKVSA